jgi:hypothetical protein
MIFPRRFIQGFIQKKNYPYPYKKKKLYKFMAIYSDKPRLQDAIASGNDSKQLGSTRSKMKQFT